MEFFNGGNGYGTPAPRPQGPRSMLPPAPGNVLAMLNSLAAQVRQLAARVAQLEQAIPVLERNDKKTADYVNHLGGVVQGVSQQTKSAIIALRRFAAGGGVQLQQFVPRASQAVVAYDTPPRSTPQAREVQPETGEGPVAEPVDPGGENGEPMTEADRLFYSGEED